MRAYWAAISLGPYKEGQVVLLEPDSGWVRTGWFVEIVNSWPPDDGRLYVRVDPETGRR
jgi:hypothetical protein